MSDQQPDFSAILEQAAALQQQLTEARASASAQVVEGAAGNGLVKVTVTGGMEFQGVKIDPSVVEDVEMLEDLLLAALRDAVSKVDEVNQQAAGDLFS